MNILNERAIADGHTKTRGPWLAFDQRWFKLNQPLLLWALNTPVLGKIVRGLLRINMADVLMPRNTRIIEIAPNYYTVRLATGEFRTDFRTHWKYSKRVYYAWKSLWWALHRWDSAVADRWAPGLSFGFSTLTAYPDPHTETATVDGWVRRAGFGNTWADVRDGAGTEINDSVDNSPFAYISSDSGDWTRIYRSIFLFDTSALTAGATISAAVGSLQGNAKADPGSWTPDINIYASAPASNTSLAAADYGQVGTTPFATAITYSGWSTSAYNDFALNAAGLAAIAKTGITKLGARNANYDVANTAPSPVSTHTAYLWGIFADTAGTTTDPKLVVTYTAATYKVGQGMFAL